MRKKFNKKPVLLAAAALVLTASLSIGSAMAFFSAYSTAKGEKQLEIGFTETIPKEEIDGEGKHVTIGNIGDYDCFVRVKVYSEVEVGYQPAKAEDWEAGNDGYWYYKPVLPAGESSSELLVTITYPADTEEEKPEEFNVVVIQECTPVVYNEDGTPAADWTTVITAEDSKE